jgi:probable rRNA maturation factor
MKMVLLVPARPGPRIPRPRYERKAAALLSKEGCKSRVDVILAGDPQLRRLNRRFRKKDRPTDVLSFNFNDPGFLGEIYISLDRVRIQSRRYGCPFNEEFQRLLIHGLFHLLGYNHGSAMRKKEELWMRYWKK